MTAPAETVDRYRLPITDHVTVRLPDGSRVLSVGPPRDGRDALDLWARVDPTSPLRAYRFWIVGTGHPLPDRAGRFVGTAVTHGGSLVWHVFADAAETTPDGT